jgi:hypothetical protein
VYTCIIVEFPFLNLFFHDPFEVVILCLM